MDLAKLQSLIEMVGRSDIDHFSLTEGDCTLTLSRTTTSEPNTKVVKPDIIVDNASNITAPSFGIIHLSASPDAPPFIHEGQIIRKGETVFILEVMKAFSEVHAPYDCKITQILCQQGDEVDTGQVLATLEVV